MTDFFSKLLNFFLEISPQSKAGRDKKCVTYWCQCLWYIKYLFVETKKCLNIFLRTVTLFLWSQSDYLLQCNHKHLFYIVIIYIYGPFIVFDNIFCVLYWCLSSKNMLSVYSHKQSANLLGWTIFWAVFHFQRPNL